MGRDLGVVAFGVCIWRNSIDGAFLETGSTEFVAGRRGRGGASAGVRCGSSGRGAGAVGVFGGVFIRFCDGFAGELVGPCGADAGNGAVLRGAGHQRGARAGTPDEPARPVSGVELAGDVAVHALFCGTQLRTPPQRRDAGRSVVGPAGGVAVPVFAADAHHGCGECVPTGAAAGQGPAAAQPDGAVLGRPGPIGASGGMDRRTRRPLGLLGRCRLRRRFAGNGELH